MLRPLYIAKLLRGKEYFHQSTYLWPYGYIAGRVPPLFIHN